VRERADRNGPAFRWNTGYRQAVRIYLDLVREVHTSAFAPRESRESDLPGEAPAAERPVGRFAIKHLDDLRAGLARLRGTSAVNDFAFGRPCARLQAYAAFAAFAFHRLF